MSNVVPSSRAKVRRDVAPGWPGVPLTCSKLCKPSIHLSMLSGSSNSSTIRSRGRLMTSLQVYFT